MGMIVAASTLAPNSPIAKSVSENWPATGLSASAAWPAVWSVMPLPKSAAAVATTTKTAMTLVHTDPTMASACSRPSSSSSMPFSATADWR